MWHISILRNLELRYINLNLDTIHVPVELFAGWNVLQITEYESLLWIEAKCNDILKSDTIIGINLQLSIDL